LDAVEKAKFKSPWRIAYTVTATVGEFGAMEELQLIEVDATGLDCPMPLLKAKRALNAMQVGQRLRLLATDRGSLRDFRVFADQSGHFLLASEEVDGIYTYLLQKN
jgi:tRNA 2-thiouridine synthesizing protein A